MAGTTTVGVKLQRGDGATPTETFSDVGRVVNIGGPSGSRPQVDVSDLLSTAREFIGGLKDEGEVTLEVNYKADDPQHGGIESDFSADALRNWKIVLPSPEAATFSFAARVQQLAYAFSLDNARKLNLTLKISGPVTKS